LAGGQEIGHPNAEAPSAGNLLRPFQNRAAAVALRTKFDITEPRARVMFTHKRRCTVGEAAAVVRECDADGISFYRIG
jgi:hypothetical protein